jgi:ubiquinone/menaquinone biosynthesis C-methylase UbiE
MRHETDFDRNRVLSDNYEQRPRWFIPGYHASHAMAAVLLRDRIGDRGRILVVGAGGGIELAVFAQECRDWTFTAVDSSAEMLRQAKIKLEAAGAVTRVSWVQGGVENSPKTSFDAATAFLALHFVPDGRRLSTLQEIHARLKPGAPFLMIKRLCRPQLRALRRRPADLRRFRAPKRSARRRHRFGCQHATRKHILCATRARRGAVGPSRFL